MSETVTIPKEEYERMKATIEVLSDSDLMEQLRKSEEDVKKGRLYKWDSEKEEWIKDF